MDKGIRPACNAKFLELLPTRVNTREGNTAFRKTVIGFVMEEFLVTLASAATHYNHAFINAKEVAKTDPVVFANLEGLGRPEDKKGGRKPKAKVEPTPAPVEECLTVGELTGDIQPEDVAPDAVQEPTVETPEGVVALVDETPAAPAVVEALYSVWKVVKNVVVATGLTKAQADELVEKAAAQKKAKLEARPE